MNAPVRAPGASPNKGRNRSPLAPEIERRRTFAIISHPDAGKTTLTEKLLLYAGAIELAGAVRGSKTQRHAVSDWMELEQQRGISISAAALEFELEGHHVTLLDTPGHQDFSEDTYRTLLAVDSVVMVLGAGTQDGARCRRQRRRAGGDGAGRRAAAAGADRRDRDHHRRRDALRPRRLSARPADAGLLRQRAERLRRRAVPARAALAGAEP